MECREVIRAEEEWQRAGAYSVRIQGMNRQYNIFLRDEFDEHDGDGAKYIVILEDGYPISTSRFYAVSAERVVLGRFVVLPEYRGLKIGSKVIEVTEKWIRECGFKEIEIDSRTVAIGFYEKCGYKAAGEEVVKSGSFDCVKMYNSLM